MSVKVYFACVFPDSFWVKPLVPVFKAVTREKSGLFFRRRYTTKLSWSGSQFQLKRMPPFRDAPARRVNEQETGASLGLETGTVAAGVEEAGTLWVVEISGVVVAGSAGTSDGISVDLLWR